jgi:hypothetical protein
MRGVRDRATNYFRCKINLTKSSREVQSKKFIASISNITTVKRYCCCCCDHAACQEVLRPFETFHIRDQRLQIIRRQIDRGHAAGVHFRGGMFEEFGQLVRGEFCFYANQRWGGGRAYSGVTVARVARLCLEDGLSFRGQRIRERHIRGSHRIAHIAWLGEAGALLQMHCRFRLLWTG